MVGQLFSISSCSKGVKKKKVLRIGKTSEKGKGPDYRYKPKHLSAGSLHCRHPGRVRNTLQLERKRGNLVRMGCYQLIQTISETIHWEMVSFDRQVER